MVSAQTADMHPASESTAHFLKIYLAFLIIQICVKTFYYGVTNSEHIFSISLLGF